MAPETLKAWRRLHGMKQHEAAMFFNVHPITYAKWEGGEPMKGASVPLAALLQDEAVYALAEKRLVKS